MTSFEENDIPQFKIVFVDSIYDYVAQDDIEYANSLKEELQNIYGLCYANKKGEIELLVLKDKGITTEGTLYHEYTHGVDYYMFSQYTGNKDIRKLQENDSFHLWSEFHATYVCYKILIEKNGYEKDAFSVVEELKKEIEEYLNNQRILLSEAVDFFVRIFGKYIAILESEKELPKYPRNFFLTRNFAFLYFYLYKHRTFDSVKDNLDELEAVFRKLEEDSKVE